MPAYWNQLQPITLAVQPRPFILVSVFFGVKVTFHCVHFRSLPKEIEGVRTEQPEIIAVTHWIQTPPLTMQKLSLHSGNAL